VAGQGSHLIFAGEFEHRIDPQGRISIPARFRPAFEDGIVLSKAYDRCVIVYTPQEWEKVAASLASQPTNMAAARRLNRLTFSGAYPTQLDRSGRVLIPPQLRQYAGLGENIMLVGTGRFFEIWDRAAWQQESESMDAQAPEIAEAAPRVSGGAAGGDGS
jgi:MraZ protein